MSKYHDYLEPNCFYHIYNRAISSEKLFWEDQNYTFFLEKWEKYIIPYVNIWAYCLIPNHFHFAVEIKDLQNFPEKCGINKFLEDQFKKLFSSYTLSFNKVYERKGSLFQKSFKRTKVDSRNYLITLIHYIHHNPIHHHFVKDYADWNYSSYSTILSNSLTNVSREKVLHYFGGRTKFIGNHDQMRNYNEINHLTIE